MKYSKKQYKKGTPVPTRKELKALKDIDKRGGDLPVGIFQPQKVAEGLVNNGLAEYAPDPYGRSVKGSYPVRLTSWGKTFLHRE